MIQRKCPYAKAKTCLDRGNCDNCDWDVFIKRYEKKLKKIRIRR